LLITQLLYFLMLIFLVIFGKNSDKIIH
jgi:hypothetical protein